MMKSRHLPLLLLGLFPLVSQAQSKPQLLLLNQLQDSVEFYHQKTLEITREC